MLNEISKAGIVPVIKLDDAEKAVPLAKALIDGGLPVAEVTFRTDAAAESIKKMTDAYPDMLVGAGTVLTVEQAKCAKEMGAKFIVSPGFNPKVVSWCVENDILSLPGCTTPSEIEAAIELGLKAVKFFPAEQSGGLAKIKALSAPYHNMKFIPTGGISLSNLNEYLSCKCILACGGSFMVPSDCIASGDWEKITLLTRNAVNAMLGIKLSHIGINSSSDDDALLTAKAFSSIFGGAEITDNGAGFFAGTSIESMRPGARGSSGHIAIGANNLDRVVYYLEKQGFSFDFSTAKYDADGALCFIYLKKEIGGFGVHFTRN